MDGVSFGLCLIELRRVPLACIHFVSRTVNMHAGRVCMCVFVVRKLSAAESAPKSHEEVFISAVMRGGRQNKA